MRPTREPVFDRRRFMHGVVVHHQMDNYASGDPGDDALEEIQKFRGAMTLIAFADHGPVAMSKAAKRDVVPFRI